MKIEPEKIVEQELLSLHLPEGYLRMRRFFDLVIVIIISPAALILGIIVAIAIRINSPGPALFIQKRPGKSGSFFYIYKFRTMTQLPRGEEDWKSYKHRITRVGSFLRKHRIDELPQLINVLKGEMSLIGPRPEPAEYFIECTKQIPLYKYRFMVSPGITGWSQVQFGHTDDIAGAKLKLEYDLYYLHNISYKLDIRILFSTILTTLLAKK